ncbi:hypothetical protein [Tenacibaculum amylolyticum]|uniref:hypothetical protein n=1 Tax=Tenacibaculum amylolyticum TaxID=104269 RepID=UPI00389371C6
MIYIQLILLLGIFLQDIKERKVYVFLLLLALLVGGYTYYDNTFTPQLFFINIFTNAMVVSIIVLLLFLYTKFKIRKNFFQAIGFGDILFFLALSVSFPTITFLVLFSSSLLFSLLLFISIKSKLNNKAVPLAGFQALFVFLILFINLVFNILNLYAI